MIDTSPFLRTHHAALLDRWLPGFEAAGSRLATVLTQDDRRRFAGSLLDELVAATASDAFADKAVSDFPGLRDVLDRLSASLAEHGLSPTETATVVFSLKGPIFEILRANFGGDDLAMRSWTIGRFLDKLGLYTFETYALTRERLIRSQADAIAELSTPVIKV